MKTYQMRFLIAAMALLLGLSHCGRDPGRTLHFDGATTLKLNNQACRGKMISSPYELEAPAGVEMVLDLANPGATTVDLQLGDVGRFTIESADWAHFSFTARKSPITLSWEGPDLFLGEPYLKPQEQKPLPNVLLLSIDTLRHDYFTPEHMPLTHALFEKGMIFQNIRTPAPWTLPAHASLFTSLYPASHGVRMPNEKLSASLPTLPGVFQDQGYYTLAFTEGNYVSATFGLNHGFHRFIEDPPAMMALDPTVVSRLAANLDRFRTELDSPHSPLFVFFHTYEVHCPYLPRNNMTDPSGKGGTDWLLNNDGKELDQETLEHLRQLYQAEVAYTDSLLGPFLAELLERGNWVVALVSDHGDEFGEHGGLLHADNLYEEAVRVPFALAGWGVEPGHQEVSGSLVDAPSTILGLLNFPAPDSWQGRDLQRDHSSRMVFSESFFFGVHLPSKIPVSRLSGMTTTNSFKPAIWIK